MADKKVTNVEIKANYDLLSIDGNIDLWGVTFEKKEDGYYANVPKEIADEMIGCGRAFLVE